MSKLASFFSAASLLVLAACGQAPADPGQTSVAEIQLGSTKAQDKAFAEGDFTSCTLCHGVDLHGNAAVDAPALTQLPSWYLNEQLKAFRAGWRGFGEDDLPGDTMQATAAHMDDAAITAAIAYVASKPVLEVSVDVDTASGAYIRGKALYEETCAACHGATALGDQDFMAPPLAGIAPWYLAEQMRKFKSGARGYHEDDLNGQTMKMAAEAFSEDGLADLSLFLEAQPLK